MYILTGVLFIGDSAQTVTCVTENESIAEAMVPTLCSMGFSVTIEEKEKEHDFDYQDSLPRLLQRQAM